jgi:hypothetical protein
VAGDARGSMKIVFLQAAMGFGIMIPLFCFVDLSDS